MRQDEEDKAKTRVRRRVEMSKIYHKRNIAACLIEEEVDFFTQGFPQITREVGIVTGRLFVTQGGQRPRELEEHLAAELL